MLRNNFKKGNAKGGFTLVEMLVSVAIFSIVVLISLGAILTILDANRKARTLTEVMNNLNFSIEMITRSIKTGVEPNFSPQGESINPTLSVGAINLDEDGFQREGIWYQLDKDSEDRGFIAICKREINSVADLESGCVNDWQPITSEMVDIDKFEIVEEAVDVSDGTQPRVQMLISGSVRINERIVSDFAIQTTVSQRKLNLSGSEID